MSTSSLLGLPTEVLLMVVQNMTDIQTLVRLSLTCSSMYRIWTDHQIEILTSVLRQLLHVKLGVAVEADFCARVDNADENLDDNRKLETFLNTYRVRRAGLLIPGQAFQDPAQVLCPYVDELDNVEFDIKSVVPTPLGPWPNRDGSYLSKLCMSHVLLERSVNAFLQRVLKVSDDEGLTNLIKDRRLAEPSQTELQRLYRAFYRFHLCHKLSFKVSDSYRRTPDSAGLWLASFPPHEIDEVGVVCQWLNDEWMDILQSLPAPEQGRYLSHNYWTQETSVQEVILQQGLSFLLTAKRSHQLQLSRLLADACQRHSGEDYIFGFLRYRPSSFLPYSDGQSLNRYRVDGDALEFHGDDCDWPNDAWLWSNNYRMTREYHSPQDKDLRKIGYTMWDKIRLSSWSIYDEPRTKSRPRSATRER